MTKNAIYGGRDPRAVPMYRLVEAARLLRVPASTLRSWTKGQDDKVQGERRRFLPPIPLDKGQESLTFFNLVEAFVLASMRRDHNVELAVVRRSVDFVREKMGVERPLLTKDFYADRGAAEQHWAVISCDVSVKRRPAEKEILMRAGVCMYILRAGLPRDQIREALVKALPTVIRRHRQLAPPVICHISRDGEVTVKVGERRSGIRR